LANEHGRSVGPLSVEQRHRRRGQLTGDLHKDGDGARGVVPK